MVDETGMYIYICVKSESTSHRSCGERQKMYVLGDEDDHENRRDDDVPKKKTHVLLSVKRLEVQSTD